MIKTINLNISNSLMSWRPDQESSNNSFELNVNSLIILKM